MGLGPRGLQRRRRLVVEQGDDVGLGEDVHELPLLEDADGGDGLAEENLDGLRELPVRLCQGMKVGSV